MRAILHHRFIVDHLPSRPHETSQVADLLPEEVPVVQPQAASLTLACDGMFFMVSVGLALVFRAVVIALWPAAGSAVDRAIVEWGGALLLLGEWLWFLSLDAFRCSQNRNSQLPFSYTGTVVRRIYRRRMEISGWTIAISAILLFLCVLFVGTPLISKLFLASVIALVVCAIRKSIPFERLSCAMAVGVFLTTVTAIAIAHTVMSASSAAP